MLHNLMLRCTLVALVWTVALGAHAYADEAKRISVSAGDLTTAVESQGGSAAGQNNGKNPGSSSEDAESKLEQVIVIARRREENIQTVPIAITVVSQQTLQENNVQTIGDLQYLVPSMSANNFLSRDAVNVSIRGQGTNSISSLPGVVGYLNEVPIPTDKDGNLAGGPGLLFDLENVQVLKGPQGTLFGRNSTGGALLVQTARPTNDFGGRFQFGYGNHNDREIDGAINVPIVNDVLLARIAFNGQARDGFTHVLGEPGHPNGIDADNRDYWAARGTVAFHPNERFQNDAILTFLKYTDHGSPVILTNLDPNGLAAFLFPEISTLFTQQQALGIRTAIPLDTRLESSGSTLSLNNISRFGLTDELTFRNIFGLDVTKTVYAVDSDATALPLLDLPNMPRAQTVRQFTDEAQLLGKTLAGRFNWIVGAFFLDQPTPAGYVLQTGTVFGLPFDGIYRQGDKSKALFGQGTYDLSALMTGVKFTAGARYTWDDHSGSGAAPPIGTACTGPSDCGVITSTETKSSALTWTAGLDYQAAPETLLYLTSRRGYRAGGSNGPVLPEFSPEYVTDVEFGVKSDWKAANIPIRTNADVYYQNYRDIQVQIDSVINGVPEVATANAAAARIWGAEFEALVQLTKDLQLGANFDYLNLNYTHFDSGVPAAEIAQLTATRTAPPRKYSVNARYHLPLVPQIGDISLRANWNWQDSSGDFSQPGGVINAFGLLNLAVNWDGIGGTSLDASLFASNLTDKVYSIGGHSYYNQGVGFAVQMFGEPRMYGVRLRYRFGPG